jgi:hypothetical protein
MIYAAFYALAAAAGPGVVENARRGLYVFLGVLSLIAGIIGAILPIIPGIPFLILSASLFARGSERAHRWLLDNPLFGSFIRAEYEGRPLPPVWKWLFILSIWVATALTILFIPTALWLDIVQIVIAAVFTVYFLARRRQPRAGR